MNLVGDCLLLLTTEAPVESSNEYQRVHSATRFYFAAAAALFIALAFLLPSSGSNDEKSKHLLQSSFDEENNPDVIERERSVFKKGLPKPDISEFTGQLVSVQEEVAVAMTENIVTEEIPWPSKDEGSFDNVVDTNKAS